MKALSIIALARFTSSIIQQEVIEQYQKSRE